MGVHQRPPPCPHPRLSTQRSLSPGQGRSRGAPAAGVAGSGEAQPGVGLGDRPLTLLFPGLPKVASTSQGPGQRSAGPHTSQGPSCRRSRGGKWGRTGRCLPQTQKKAPPLQLLRSGSRGPAPSPRPAPPRPSDWLPVRQGPGGGQSEGGWAARGGREPGAPPLFRGPLVLDPAARPPAAWPLRLPLRGTKPSRRRPKGSINSHGTPIDLDSGENEPREPRPGPARQTDVAVLAAGWARGGLPHPAGLLPARGLAL